MILIGVLIGFALVGSALSFVPPAEVEDLQTLYNSTQGDLWIWSKVSSRPKWNFTISSTGDYLRNPCADDNAVWQGVSCSGTPVICAQTSRICHIVAIDLSSYNLGGNLPAYLTNIYLTELQVRNNRIGGTIPSAFSALTNLEILDLSVNKIVGPIPDEIYALGKLITIIFISIISISISIIIIIIIIIKCSLLQL
jgi:hypothetical protein